MRKKRGARKRLPTASADVEFHNWHNLRPTVLDGLPGDEYHKAPGVSATDLKRLQQSGGHYLSSRNLAPSGKPVESQSEDELDANESVGVLQFGQCVHAAILEPDTVDDVYLVGPKVSTKRVKAWKEFVEAHPHHMVITPKEQRTIERMRDAVMAHKYARVLLNPDDGPCERSVWSLYTSPHAPDRPVLCKARPDKLNDEHWAIVDYKTTRDAGYSAFSASMARYGYDLLQVHYIDVLRAHEETPRLFVFIAQEKNPPYAVAIYELHADDVYAARLRRQALLADWLRRVDENDWGTYEEAPRVISLPNWSKRGRIS